jgi:hypothetical protein
MRAGMRPVEMAALLDRLQSLDAYICAHDKRSILLLCDLVDCVSQELYSEVTRVIALAEAAAKCAS